MNAEKELQKVENELEEISKQLEALLDRQSKLEEKKMMLESQISHRREKLLDTTDWNATNFSWSQLLIDKMKSVFGIDKLRDLQHQTMNVTMSKEDCILIMPTGGGKSLCYQLPAVVSKGVTVVVSPLVSLMEDQLMALTRLRVPAQMFSASAGIKETNRILKEMLDPSSKMKLLYVTPEKVAKSKRFMHNLEKMYAMGRLERIAIDEVHCCSQWGHDFRPDYKFLGIMKRQFPGVPILGLTATSTTSVTHDVQKMLNIQGCLVLRASFNRPNLNYMVLPKPSNAKEALDTLAEMIKRKYKHDSGIIYCCSIKDCEDIAKELRLRNIKAGTYHATLEPAARSTVHQAWTSNDIKLVVATIAFGMGIDKPDVRYVIHHSISKSMENYYQESGRAGRDDKPADCIVFYRFNDIFRQSTMVFTEQTGLDNLHAVIAYCIDGHRCRRSLIATHFGEEWTPKDCQKMCDHCKSSGLQAVQKDVTKYCLHLYAILDAASGKADKQNLTGMKLVDAWMGKGATNLRVKSVPVPNFSRELCERIVAHLLIENFLREDFHFTPYSTLSYILPGQRAPLVKSGKLRVEIEVAQSSSTVTPSATSTTSTPKSSSSSVTKAGNHHSLSEKKTKEKSSQPTTPSKMNFTPVSEKNNSFKDSSKKKSGGDRKDSTSMKRKVVVCSSSDSDSDFDPLFGEPKKKRAKSTNKVNDSSDSDFDPLFSKSVKNHAKNTNDVIELD